jgi:transitional endoplasmic reticulum ATPase
MSTKTKLRASAAVPDNIGAAMIGEFMAQFDPAQAWAKRDVDIDHTGTKITLPADPSPMPLRTAIEALERKAQDEETELDVHELIDAFPEDALVAFNEAMRQKYGWASPTPKMTFFGPIAPDLITVKTGPNIGDEVQVPFGQFTLPGVENPIQTHRHRMGDRMVLIITGSVRKREAPVVKELANLARQILGEGSIYKGKAIRLKVDDDGDLVQSEAPTFLSTAYINPDELVLNPDELEQVRAALWAPVQNTEACIRHKIPLKRGVLLEGTYGTGKTMTANVTSKVCVDNGWTYILLDDVRALKEALLFAQRYAPAVVFAEDAERVAEDRDQRGNDLLNTIDGVLSKNSQVITVLTTNFVERLDSAMLRPGRLDAVISIRPPEAEAVERLIRLYGRGLVAQGEDLSEVGAALAGNIPATVREVVERSKLAMVANGRDQVAAEDLLISARGMERHLSLLAGKTPEPTVEERVGQAFGDLIAKRLGLQDDEGDPLLGDLTKSVHEAHCTAHQLTDAVGGMTRAAGSSAKKVAAMADTLEEVDERTKKILDEVS